MDTVKLIQVIETTNARRGNGIDDPIRVITQYWSMDGTLLWEIDPIYHHMDNTIKGID